MALFAIRCNRLQVDCYLFWKLAQRDAKRHGYSFAICRIGLEAIAYVADLNLLGGISHGTGSVSEKHRLLLGAHQAEQLAGLGVIIFVRAMVPMIGGSLQTKGWFGEFRLLLPLAVAVRLIAEGAAVIAVHSHGTIAVITMYRTTRRVDGNEMVIHSKPVTLRIAIGE